MLLFCSLLYSFLFLVLNRRGGAERGRAGRNWTDADFDSNAGQDRGAGRREEEVDGWAGGLRRQGRRRGAGGAGD